MENILLVGQSYGAAVATLMAANNPGKVAGLVLLSSFLGELGPTARWLVDMGQRMTTLIPRDLRHAILEVTGQASQLPRMREALGRLTIPVHVIHGDKDDFAPTETVERLLEQTPTRRSIRFERVAGADHFLNRGPTEQLQACLEACIRQSKPRRIWLRAPRLPWPRPSGAGLEERAGA